VGPSDGRYPLCTFQAISRETELASKILFVGSWRLKKEVTIPFNVTALQSADPASGSNFGYWPIVSCPLGSRA
jgi:hypothetical protein